MAESWILDSNAPEGLHTVAGGNAPGTATQIPTDPEGVAEGPAERPATAAGSLYSTLSGSGLVGMPVSGGVAPGYFMNPLRGFSADQSLILAALSEYTGLVAQVFLAGKDWQARALLRAQLLEEGVSVEAFETVAEALAQLEFFPVRPALLIADISASDHPSADVDSLANWATRVPIWIIAGHTSSLNVRVEGRGFDRLLFRPVDLGQLVGQIRQRLSQ